MCHVGSRTPDSRRLAHKMVLQAGEGKPWWQELLVEQVSVDLRGSSERWEEKDWGPRDSSASSPPSSLARI